MNELTTLSLLAVTFTRADVAYRISLLRGLFEWVFFSVHEDRVTAANIDRFESEKHISIADAAFLKDLPSDFWEGWTKEVCYERLDKMTEAVARVPVLSLMVPVTFAHAHTEALGIWVRRVVHPQILLEFITDPALGAGCQFVWRDHLHDFSFSRFVHAHRSALRARLARAAPDLA